MGVVRVETRPPHFGSASAHASKKPDARDPLITKTAHIEPATPSANGDRPESAMPTITGAPAIIGNPTNTSSGSPSTSIQKPTVAVKATATAVSTIRSTPVSTMRS